jgi:DNA-directed RNA polymerase subunit M/transcription elongation factor TFIIS
MQELDGYTLGAPSVDAAAIDSEVCQESICPKCGNDGMDYEPWHKDGSYRAFAVCPKCGYREEF